MVDLNNRESQDLSKLTVSQNKRPPAHAVIILASGLSQRLGQPKQLLKKQCQPLLEIMTNLALANHPESIVLVVPSSHPQIIQLSQILSVQHTAIEPVINSQPNLGMAHSLSLAVDTLTTKVAQGMHVERVLILGVDQILLEATHLQQLLAGDQASIDIKQRDIKQGALYKKVIASHYPKSYEITEKSSFNLKHKEESRSIIGLPINIDYELLKQWQSTLVGDKGLRHLIRGLTSDELGVVYNPQLSLDIDTVEQLEFATDKGWLD